jgi:hypothetical protein
LLEAAFNGFGYAIRDILLKWTRDDEKSIVKD